MAECLGFMYIARRKCGRVSAAAWDDADWSEKEKQRTLAEWEKRGDSIERVERFVGDPSPTWVCPSKDCTSCNMSR